MGVLRKALNWYAKLSPARGKVSPPYKHVTQLGDPVLRNVADPVPLDEIKSEKIQKTISMLNYVMNKYESVGMAAPQIGISLRIFVMRLTEKQLSEDTKEIIKLKGITVVPPTVFINPKMKVVDYQKLLFTEGCESVKGYAADVPRYREVEISGYNAEGEPTRQLFKDWAARIAQHEIDHLDGKIFVDTMDKKSLHCVCWDEVNLSQGKVVIPFSPE